MKATLKNRAGISSAITIIILVLVVSVIGTMLILNTGLLVLNIGPNHIDNSTQLNWSINNTILSEP